MGAGASAQRRDRFLASISNPDRIHKFTAIFHIQEDEMEKVFRTFDKIDKDKSGEIELGEFLRNFNLDWNGLGRYIFNAIDISGDCTVEFPEYFVALWNYCTMDKNNLKRFAFDLFDFDGNGTIDLDEFKKLLSILYGHRNVDMKAENLMKILDSSKDKEITYAEFETNVEKMPSLLFQAFSLQRLLRNKTLGEAYWVKATKRRHECLPEGGDLLDLYFRLYNDGESLLRSKEKEKHGPGIRNGIVKFENMTSKSSIRLFSEPKKAGKLRAKLKANQQVMVINEVQINNQKWYELASSSEKALYVPANCITIQSTIQEADEFVEDEVDEEDEEKLEEEEKLAKEEEEKLQAKTEKFNREAESELEEKELEPELEPMAAYQAEESGQAYQEPEQAYQAEELEQAYQEPEQAYQTYQESEQTYQEQAYQEPEQTNQEQAYQEPEQTYQEQAYQEPEQTYQEQAYQEPEQTYQEQAYQEPEQMYQEQTYQEPVQTYPEQTYQEQQAQ